MDIQEYDNSVRRLLGMKGSRRLEVSNSLTDKILGFPYSEQTPGLRLKFLETRKQDLEYGGWVNYNVLIEADKRNDTPEYLSYIFEKLSEIIKAWEGEGEKIDVVGIQEVDNSEAEFYYVLLYILGDGKDNKEKDETFIGD